ncbi:hypothetical protein [Burkholderia ubonensis]|uniref:hypothetical protein n=1 Tax=Burkholderia ubonensis TaxID=101571 RepID=UPI00075DAA18|nr:hypothetical protein [Burkholderia ubonensis]KVQ12441.1 hypothetical protein WJ98_28840 [Burkholderia ubonensis]KVQ12598.1 hypothetical protein WJ98_29645 [Burkholderia ubonensis]KWI69649.1 hypothetical protein WM07_00935 [Burkholderia ubonensis]
MQNWKLVLGLLLSLAGVLFVALLGATTAWTKQYDPTQMAYWVQAVGSIAAIAGAVWIGERQAKKAREAAMAQVAEAALVKRKSAIAIVDAAYARAEIIRETMSLQDIDSVRVALYSTYDRSILDGLVRALQSIPMHEVGSSQAVAELLLFTDQFTFLARAIQIFLDGPTRDPDIGPEIEKYLKGDRDDRRAGAELRANVIEVYRGNTIRHLDAIGRHHAEFSLALA